MSLAAQLCRDLEESHADRNPVVGAANHQSAAGHAASADSTTELPLFAAAEQLYGERNRRGKAILLVFLSAFLLVGAIVVSSYLSGDFRAATKTLVAAFDNTEPVKTDVINVPQGKTASVENSANSSSAAVEAPKLSRLAPEPSIAEKLPSQIASASISTTVAAEKIEFLKQTESGQEAVNVKESEAVKETAAVKSTKAVQEIESVVNAGAVTSAGKDESERRSAPIAAIKTPRPLTTEQRDLKVSSEAGRMLDRGLRVSALALLQRELKRDERMHDSTIMLISLLIDQQSHVAAADHLRRANELFPPSLEFSKLQVRLAMVQQDFATALQLLDQLAVPVGRDAEFLEYRAVALQSTSEFEAAIVAYQQLLAYDSRQARWWMGLAIALDASARFEDAKRAYNNALASENLPDNLGRYAHQRVAQL